MDCWEHLRSGWPRGIKFFGDVLKLFPALTIHVYFGICRKLIPMIWHYSLAGHLENVQCLCNPSAFCLNKSCFKTNEIFLHIVGHPYVVRTEFCMEMNVRWENKHVSARSTSPSDLPTLAKVCILIKWIITHITYN